MKNILLALFTTIGIGVNAEQFDWAKGFGSSVQDEGKSIATDASGNVYITGTFRFTADFDPGTDTFELTTAGGSDVFVQKLNAAGDFVWAVNMGGTNFETVRSVFVDNAGFVYVTGSFSGSADFNPSPLPGDTFNLNSVGIDDIFVVKLTQAGAFVWAKSMGGSSTDEGFAIAADGTGNVYVGGRFQGTANFSTTSGTTNLIANGGGDDFFICQLNSIGALQWAHGTGGTGNDYCLNITLDNSNNVIATGYYSSPSIDFDPNAANITLNHGGASDIFVLKYDAAGNFLWSRGFGSAGYDIGYDVVTDASGNVYTTGRFEGTVDFDPGNSTFDLTSAGQQDVYILKLDVSGNFSWAKSLGSGSPEWGQSVDIDGVGGLYFTGFFQETIDFNPGSGTASLSSAGGEDVFVAKFDVGGNFVWAKALGGTNSQFGDRGEDLAVDATGNVYTTGWFYDAADFDPTVDTMVIVSQGNFDIFVHKISQPGNSIGETESNMTIALYPNPTIGETTLDLPEMESSIQLNIYNALGQSVLTNYYTNTNRIKFDSEFGKGVYFVKLSTARGKTAYMKLLRE